RSPWWVTRCALWAPPGPGGFTSRACSCRSAWSKSQIRSRTAAVVAGAPRDYRDAHPATAVLIVEVAETSLRYDRTQKASLYARSDIAEYWIVNLPDRQLEVYRDPQPDAAQPFGFGYASVRILGEQDRVSPLAAPGVAIAVADLLP